MSWLGCHTRRSIRSDTFKSSLFPQEQASIQPTSLCPSSKAIPHGLSLSPYSPNSPSIFNTTRLPPSTSLPLSLSLPLPQPQPPLLLILLLPPSHRPSPRNPALHHPQVLQPLRIHTLTPHLTILNGIQKPPHVLQGDSKMIAVDLEAPRAVVESAAAVCGLRRGAEGDEVGEGAEVDVGVEEREE